MPSRKSWTTARLTSALFRPKCSTAFVDATHCWRIIRHTTCSRVTPGWAGGVDGHHVDIHQVHRRCRPLRSVPRGSLLPHHLAYGASSPTRRMQCWKSYTHQRFSITLKWARERQTWKWYKQPLWRACLPTRRYLKPPFERRRQIAWSGGGGGGVNKPCPNAEVEIGKGIRKVKLCDAATVSPGNTKVVRAAFLGGNSPKNTRNPSTC